MTTPEAMQSLERDWKSADAVQVGRTLMEPLSPANQVARAAAVLDVCRTKWTVVPAVEAVAKLARNPDDWTKGHAAFDAVRDLSLLESRTPTNRVYCTLLFVAEITAQTIYNASSPRNPFDDDSPWWIAANARDMAGAVNDPEFEKRLWTALTT